MVQAIHPRERFGFNNQSTGLWITDKLKEFFIGCLLFTTLISLLHLLYAGLFKYSQNFWWIFAFCAVFSISDHTHGDMPRFIIPMFNTMKPLEDYELQEET